MFPLLHAASPSAEVVSSVVTDWRIRFTQAEAHDASDTGTVVSAPARHVGYPAINEYAQAGDFEGVLTYAVSSFRTISRIQRPDRGPHGRGHDP